GTDVCRSLYAWRARAGGSRHRRKTGSGAIAMSIATATALTGGALSRAQGLHKNFGGVKAVSDISFEVPAGSIFAVTGPNGAGKSTLLNLISGVSRPRWGSVSFAGADIPALPVHRRVRL